MSLPHAFRSLRVRNYRRYFAGQVLSLCGTWAQNIGLGWLVLRLSHDSGVAIGVVTALQFLPILMFGLWAGLLADRFDKRRFIVATQLALAVTAGALAIVDLSGVVELWMVYVIAFVFGVATACDTPARLSFVVEMVGPTDLPNALALNSAVVNAGRIIGPAIAGAIIASGGTGLCFLVNALSYLGTIAAVMTMRRADLQQPTPVARGKGQVRAGIQYARNHAILRANLLMLAVTSLLAFNFPVVLPLMAKITFDGDARTYSLMASAMGVGAFVSALVLASIGRPFGRRIVLATLVIGAAMLVASTAPTLALFVAVLPLLGAGQVIAASSANALVQLDADPAMRGRVTALFSLTSSGVTPFGGILIGTVAEELGARWAMAAGGLGAIAAVLLFGRSLLTHRTNDPAPDPAVATTVLDEAVAPT